MQTIAIKKRVKKPQKVTVKQQLNVSKEMDDRLQSFVMAKGIKATQVYIIALNDYLTANNY